MAPADGGGEQPHKAHRQHKSGAKARKKKGKGKGAAGDDGGGEQKNPKVRYRFVKALGWCPWSDLPERPWEGVYVQQWLNVILSDLLLFLLAEIES